jgi:hypothetical protein
MQDRYAYQTTPPPGESERSTRPSSSRMLASYVADIELLLEEQRWEQALREAFDLPQIAAALSDARMQVSVDRVQAWCQQWVKHAEDAPSAADPDAGRIIQLVCERAERASLANESVPALALRRLRLHRLQRTRHRGFKAGPLAPLGPEAADAAQICTTLVQAARRWYAQSAVHDAIVQANLARLAVLR